MKIDLNDFFNSSDDINVLIGQIQGLMQMQLFSSSQTGDALRKLKGKKEYEIILNSKTIKGNNELADLLIELIDNLEKLVRSGFSINDSLEKLVSDGWLNKIEDLREINKLN